ncbi:MAG TPA: IS21 family transposase [Verrucomicrobiae bacterium]|nr:IS21 family transposase [Verrucomicrobiae bacterium]
MITRGEDVEAHALRRRGWPIAAIARHLGRDRKTIRAYLRQERVPGVRQRAAADPLAPYAPYLAARFADNAHIWASALFDEVVALGYPGRYPSFTRQVRRAGLRPHCEACAGVKGREYIEIAHPPGEELQWDWFHRRAPWGGTANVLLGSLAHSGRMRGVLAEGTDQAYLIDSMDQVLRRLGGTPRIWRTDRLATVIVPGTRDVQASFAPVAKYYGAIVEPCPPRRGNRKGVIEAAVKFACGRWWRTMTADTPGAAQLSLDRFCVAVGDARLRPPGRLADPPMDGSRPRWPSVGERAEAEQLQPLPPAPYPATLELTAPVGANATCAFRGNRYAVAPGLTGTALVLRHRLGSGTLEISSPAGIRLATHRLAAPGAGAVVRTAEQAAQLAKAVLASFSTAAPCDRKGNYPPGPTARAEAERLVANLGPEVRVDLGAYAALVEGGPDE